MATTSKLGATVAPDSPLEGPRALPRCYLIQTLEIIMTLFQMLGIFSLYPDDYITPVQLQAEGGSPHLLRMVRGSNTIGELHRTLVFRAAMPDIEHPVRFLPENLEAWQVQSILGDVPEAKPEEGIVKRYGDAVAALYDLRSTEHEVRSGRHWTERKGPAPADLDEAIAEAQADVEEVLADIVLMFSSENGEAFLVTVETPDDSISQ